MRISLFAQALICFIMFQSCLPAQQSDPQNHNDHPRQSPNIVNFPIPSNLSFCGEEVPLSDPEIAERLDREINALAYYHASTLLVLKRAHRWKNDILKTLRAEGIPADFFYVAVAESNLDNDAESYRQAVGMWQLMEATAKEMGLEVNTYVDERRDPFSSTYAACKYLKQSYGRFANWTLVAAAYNRGIAGLASALESQMVDSYYDLYLHEQTYRYIFKILAYKIILENPGQYKFQIPESELYDLWKYREITVSETISDLPTWAKEYNTTYKYIKLYNPWITSIDYSLPVKKGKTYVIRIPR